MRIRTRYSWICRGRRSRWWIWVTFMLSSKTWIGLRWLRSIIRLILVSICNNSKKKNQSKMSSETYHQINCQSGGLVRSNLLWKSLTIRIYPMMTSTSTIETVLRWKWVVCRRTRRFQADVISVTSRSNDLRRKRVHSRWRSSSRPHKRHTWIFWIKYHSIIARCSLLHWVHTR